MSLTATDKPSLDEQRYYRLLKHNAALRDVITLETVAAIKRALDNDDECHAEQLWRELEHDTTMALFVAPMYGGIFTTKERAFLASISLVWQP